MNSNSRSLLAQAMMRARQKIYRNALEDVSETVEKIIEDELAEKVANLPDIRELGRQNTELRDRLLTEIKSQMPEDGKIVQMRSAA